MNNESQLEVFMNEIDKGVNIINEAIKKYNVKPNLFFTVQLEDRLSLVFDIKLLSELFQPV